MKVQMLPNFKPVRWASLLLLTASLLACSPEYDWRTMQNNDGGYSVMFPAKPTSAGRKVTIAGQNLPMVMEAARVKERLFAVGVVDLGQDDAALRQQAVQALQQGLLANLQGGQQSSRPINGTSAATPPVAWQGTALHASGHAPQDSKPRTLHAYVLAKGQRAYQVVVLDSGKAAQASTANASPASVDEQAEQFLNSFKPF